MTRDEWFSEEVSHAIQMVVVSSFAVAAILIAVFGIWTSYQLSKCE